MNKQANILLVATAFTPTTTNTQIATQQPGNTLQSLPNWLLVEIPLFGALGFGTILGALITSVFQWRIHAKNREHAERIEEIRNKNTKDLEHVKAEYGQQLEQERQEHEQRLEEMRQTYEMKKLRVENRWELIKYWKGFLDGRRNILYLTDDERFQDLDQELSLPVSQELSQLVLDYKRQWREFLDIGLPKVRQEAKIYAANQKIIGEVTSLESERSKAEALMRSRYIRDSIDETKKELEKPLRSGSSGFQVIPVN